MTEAERKREWHLDRTVTLGLIVAVVGVWLTLIGYIVGAVWWASELDTRMGGAEGDIAKIQEASQTQHQELSRIPVIEIQVRGITTRLDRFEAKMDRWMEQRYPAVGNP